MPCHFQTELTWLILIFFFQDSESDLSTAAVELTTRSFNSEQARETKDHVVNVLFGVTGLAVFLFNGLMVLLYIKVLKIRRIITFMMMQLFIFCMIHGLVVGVIFTVHRAARYVMPKGWCVIGDLIMLFMDTYILALLPLLAIERLVILKEPYHSVRQRRKWSIIATVTIIFVTMMLAWIPIIPQLGIPQQVVVKTSIPSEVARRERFQKYFNCQGLINKQNIVTPIILLIQQIVCVAVVVGIYLHMFYISKSRMAKFSRMTAKRRKSLRRATTSVMLVAIVFIVTTIPFGITYQVRTLCDTGHIDKQLCAHITLNMRFGFGIVTHLGDLFAPMLFALFNPKIRKMLRYFVCAPCGVVPPTIESTSMGTSNHKSLEPDPEPASNEGSGSINE